MVFEQKVEDLKAVLDDPDNIFKDSVSVVLDKWISPICCDLGSQTVAQFEGEGYTQHAYSQEDIEGLLLTQNPKCPLTRKELSVDNIMIVNLSNSPEYQAAINEAYNIIHPEEDGNVKVAGGSAFAGSDSV